MRDVDTSLLLAHSEQREQRVMNTVRAVRLLRLCTLYGRPLLPGPDSRHREATGLRPWRMVNCC